MKRLLGSACVAAVLASAPAVAADLAPIYRPPAPAIVAPGVDWSGFYVGGHIGGTWGRSNVNIPNYPSNFNLNSSSLSGGVLAGFNVMTANRWVFGVEGDVSWMRLRATGLTGGPVAGETFTTDFNWMGTLRGRVGYAWDHMLVYGTGGFAWANLRNAFYTPLAPAINGTRTATLTGWTAGGGIEYALTPSWIMGVEYLYADLGRENFTFNGPTSVNLRTHTVRGRLSYKFNWASPVAARY